MKVVLIGAGNVAHALGTVIDKAGHEIVQVVSRNLDHAQSLAGKFDTEAGSLTNSSFVPADIYIVALSDAALESVEKITALKNQFVVHTAGSVSKNVFKQLTSTYGVLYPYQSLSKAATDIPPIPFFVEGNTEATLQQITEFAATFALRVVPATETDRLHYHVAAVFASNFTNHLFAIAEAYCRSEKIDFNNLLPMINEVTLRANHNSPRDVQTGPAVREDIFTINRHLEALASLADIKYLYLKLSESILKLHQKH